MINKNGVSQKKFWRPNLDWILNMVYDLPTKQPACLTWTSIRNVKFWSPTESNWPMWPMNRRGMTVPLHRSSRRCTSGPAKITLQIIFTRKKLKLLQRLGHTTCLNTFIRARPLWRWWSSTRSQTGVPDFLYFNQKIQTPRFFCCVNIPFHWKYHQLSNFLASSYCMHAVCLNPSTCSWIPELLT